MAAILSAPATAEGSRIYTCTVAGSNETVEYQFGPGEWGVVLDQSVSANPCAGDSLFGAPPDATCEAHGSQFVVRSSDGQLLFSYDAQTGAFFEAGEAGDADRRGTCRPE